MEATGRARQGFARIRSSLGADQYITVKASLTQGTYVNVPTALDLCTSWGLNELKDLIETTLRQHGYGDASSQQNHPPPISDSLPGLPSESTIANSTFFQQLELIYPR